MPNKRKIINDPVFGFITIPNDFLFDLLQHPFVQRLNRIRQLGLSYFVYPGATHTRFLHSIGAMHLTQEAIGVLRQKNIDISHDEGIATQAAILLHDIGHGPFSHVLEHTLVSGISHEDVSMRMMDSINAQMQGKLSLAISIFRNEYGRHFLHQLISSQLDMDRLDYLSRDSFFCGVQEGTVASARIIKMLNVIDDNLVVDLKGIYSVEKFLVARRLMYWQVYLHKTSVAAEQLLIKILLRARELASMGKQLFASPALRYFLYDNISAANFDTDERALQMYAMLDDSDILSAIKEWALCDDKVLSLLCNSFTNRRLFKVRTLDSRMSDEQREAQIVFYRKQLGLTAHEAQYMFSEHSSARNTYSPQDDSIGILYKDGTVQDISAASDILNLQVLTHEMEKHYLFYYKV